MIFKIAHSYSPQCTLEQQWSLAQAENKQQADGAAPIRAREIAPSPRLSGSETNSKEHANLSSSEPFLRAEIDQQPGRWRLSAVEPSQRGLARAKVKEERQLSGRGADLLEATLVEFPLFDCAHTHHSSHYVSMQSREENNNNSQQRRTGNQGASDIR